ncbi:hypothetical protein [Treponema pedis]|uniref:hypothetical protein n=1 Tax=Treponema pedis TaxID=409322 RepID=UPI003D1F243A
MKQRKVVSLIGALVVILGAVAFITGCPQANSNKDKKDNMTVNNGGTTSNNGGTTGGNTGNNGDSLAVQPTGTADPTLKGTNWSGDGKSIYFSEDGNIASIRSEQMLYTIQGEKISFDLSSFITITENMTEEKFIRKVKIDTKQDIAEFEKEIREAEKSGDEQTKTQLEAKLEDMKELLQMLENPDEQMKERIKESLEGIHEYAGKMKANAKFDGIFNSEKTELTIEKFPEYDWQTGTVKVSQIIFKKKN